MLELDAGLNGVLEVPRNGSEDVDRVTGDEQRHLLYVSLHVTQTRAVHLYEEIKQFTCFTPARVNHITHVLYFRKREA